MKSLFKEIFKNAGLRVLFLFFYLSIAIDARAIELPKIVSCSFGIPEGEHMIITEPLTYRFQDDKILHATVNYHFTESIIRARVNVWAKESDVEIEINLLHGTKIITSSVSGGRTASLNQVNTPHIGELYVSCGLQ